MSWRGPVVVTGTDAGVGKSIVAAGIAAAASAAGLRVAVIKPAQTGCEPGEASGVDAARRLAAPADVRTLTSYPVALDPLAAAQVSGLPPLRLAEVQEAVRAEARGHDLVLVEGVGGLLVPMGAPAAGEPDAPGWTVADLAVALSAPAVVVVRAGSGTLNHTALTEEALRHRGIPSCVVIGAWPAVPELVHVSNFVALARGLAGVLPDGAAALEPGVFRRSAPGWFTPLLHGTVDDVREWADEVS
jgi:dethiobiotin synthetase